MQRPNVLLVTYDQWRADHCGALGCELPITPNADRVAAAGTAFANHVSNAAPCGPSRASMLTGRYLMNHRSVQNGTPLPSGIANFATELRSAGYDPLIYGYTDTAADPDRADETALTTPGGLMEGFSIGIDCSKPDGWLAHLRAAGLDFPNEPAAFGLESENDLAAAVQRTAASFPAELSAAAYLSDRLIADLPRLSAGNAPWAVHLTYLSPHPPLAAPVPFNTLIDPADAHRPRRAGSASDEAQHPLAEILMAIGDLVAPEDPDEMANLAATYAGMVTETDAQFGRVLDALVELDNDRDTMIMVTADHGEQLGDRWLRHKLAWFPESYRVPLLIKPAGRPLAPLTEPGKLSASAIRTVTAPTEHVDLLPTVLTAVGVELPDCIDGSPLNHFLSTEPQGSGSIDDGLTDTAWKSEVFWEWDFRDPVMNLPGLMLGMRLDECSLAASFSNEHLAVVFSAERFAPLYFDRRVDPDCRHDVAQDPAYATELTDALLRLLRWRLQRRTGRHLNSQITNEGLRRAQDPPMFGVGATPARVVTTADKTLGSQSATDLPSSEEKR